MNSKSFQLKVVNIKTCPDWTKRSGDIYIGRGSPWGNPYRMNNSSMDERIRVIELFEKNTLPRLDLTALVYNANRLGCYCAPLPCHGDILKKEIEQMRRILESSIGGYLEEKETGNTNN